MDTVRLTHFRQYSWLVSLVEPFVLSYFDEMVFYIIFGAVAAKPWGSSHHVTKVFYIYKLIKALFFFLHFLKIIIIYTVWMSGSCLAKINEDSSWTQHIRWWRPFSCLLVACKLQLNRTWPSTVPSSRK